VAVTVNKNHRHDHQREEGGVTPEYVGCAVFYHMDVVRGTARCDDAYKVRADERDCGPSGRFFEPRRSTAATPAAATPAAATPAAATPAAQSEKTMIQSKPESQEAEPPSGKLVQFD